MHRIEQHIEANWSRLKSFQISVACSGGLDSIVLAYALHQLNFKIDVIHVNYKLRGEDSELDAQLVEQFCMLYSLFGLPVCCLLLLLLLLLSAVLG